MSCDIDSDSFHVKKGGRRKTVSSRRAYVNTPSQIVKKLREILPNCNSYGKIQIDNLVGELLGYTVAERKRLRFAKRAMNVGRSANEKLRGQGSLL